MADFITLTCPSCGGKLQITNDIDRFACSHCGVEHFVKRGGGIVSLSPVVDGIKQVQIGVDKTASELAIKRLSNEILALEEQRIRVGKNQGKVNLWIFLGLGMGFLISMLLIPFIGKSDDVGCIMFMPLIISIIVGIVVGMSKQSEDNQPKYNNIDQQINKRKEEIKKHKEIVQM